MTPEQRPQECLIRVGITNNVSGDHLMTPDHPYCGSTEFRCRLERALPDLAEGGYVVDLRPLADHPLIDTWVWKAPMCNGKIEGEEISRLSESSRQTAQQFLPGLEGDFQTAALVMAKGVAEAEDPNEPGGFDHASATAIARYWQKRGARVGRREGNILHWWDGIRQEIEIQEVKDA